MSSRLVVIGDALLDRDVEGEVERLCPDAPVPVVEERDAWSRPGGAALAASLCATDRSEVTLITALADDNPGAELAEDLRQRGVEVIDLGLEGTTPEKVRITSSGHPMLRVDRGGERGKVGPATAAARAAIGWAGVVLVSDYGRGVAAEPGVRAALCGLDDAKVPIVWDPHPRGPRPVPGVTIVTPNAREALGFGDQPGYQGLGALADRARRLRDDWGARAVSVTLGERGALLVGEDLPALVLPARAIRRADPCGAGDRFASAVASALGDRQPLPDAVAEAVERATAFVASGGVAGQFGYAPASEPAGLAETLRQVRSAGGTVVATGGCFDLLHTGHVRTLEAARSLGGCLVVCLNSDASVRRRKGPGRPLVPDSDRAVVLLALACVDAVEVFGEDTPERVLARVRPDIWVKGGDYREADLRERHVVQRHGGHCVMLPYLPGHSTTRLIQGAATNAG